MSSDDFELLQVIGRGSFGQIRKVRRISDGKVLVRKEISYKGMSNREKLQLLAETRILSSLVHPNVVQYVDHHTTEDQMMYLYMEYCGGGDLAEVIRHCKQQNIHVPENTVWSIFCQLILALYRCHYNEDPPPVKQLFAPSTAEHRAPPNPSIIILHRDIKPDNVFLGQGYSVKLGDFGLAKILDQEHSLANTYVGTPYYMSPEVLMDKPYTMQSDIWSLGCVIYELCALHPPFQAKSHLQLSQKIREGVFSPLPDYYSSTLSKTISACLNLNAINRPTTATLLRLDVIKLCRREREILQTQQQLVSVKKSLEEKARAIRETEAELSAKINAYNEYINHGVAEFIEQQVNKRVKEILASTSSTVDISDSSFTDNSHNSGPSNRASPLRGPRSFRRASASPSKESERFSSRDIEELSTKFLASSLDQYQNIDIASSDDEDLPVYQTDAGLKSRSCSESSIQSYKTAVSASVLDHRIAEQENDTRPSSQLKIGVKREPLSSTTNLIDIKSKLLSPLSAKHHDLTDFEKEKFVGDNLWSEHIYGHDMPSPLLRKWETPHKNN